MGFLIDLRALLCYNTFRASNAQKTVRNHPVSK